MELSVVIPVRNEAANIAPLVAELRAALDGRIDYEIVYVDDGSGDGTAVSGARAVAAAPAPRPPSHAARPERRDPQRRQGGARAVDRRRSTATARTIPRIFRDFSRSPAPRRATPPLLVAGLRAKRRDTLAKRLASRIANAVRARLLGDATPDTGCGLKVMRRELYLDLPFFDHNHRFLPALVMRLGGRTVSVPVNHRPRERGLSKYGVLDRLWVSIADLLGVMWLKRRGSRPETIAERCRGRRPAARAPRLARAMSADGVRGRGRLWGRWLVLLLLGAGIVLAWRHHAAFDPLAISGEIATHPAAPLVFLALHVAASLLLHSAHHPRDGGRPRLRRRLGPGVGDGGKRARRGRGLPHRALRQWRRRSIPRACRASAPALRRAESRRLARGGGACASSRCCRTASPITRSA